MRDKTTATRKQRKQILQAVELLLTDRAYADHWRGYKCLLTKPNFTWELTHMEEGGVWVEMCDSEHHYGAKKFGGYMVRVSADLFAFEGTLETSATKELYERWERKAKAALRQEAQIANRRVCEALDSLTKGRD